MKKSEDIMLKPCPFCGSTDIEYVENEDPELPYLHLECQCCGARGPEINSRNRFYILPTLWNTRVGKGDGNQMDQDSD